ISVVTAYGGPAEESWEKGVTTYGTKHDPLAAQAWQEPTRDRVRTGPQPKCGSSCAERACRSAIVRSAAEVERRCIPRANCGVAEAGTQRRTHDGAGARGSRPSVRRLRLGVAGGGATRAIERAARASRRRRADSFRGLAGRIPAGRLG